jgi:uncharacterized cofD-like protein
MMTSAIEMGKTMGRNRSAEPPEKVKIVALGGGTGLPVVLAGLKRDLGGKVESLTAVVTVADDGGSSGRLREEFHVLPPGDIRNCLVALAEVEPLMGRLFQYRFGGEGTLAGHNFGNLFLTALTHVTGDFLSAIRVSSKVLAVQGTILPSTLENVRLGAELVDGNVVMGEGKIGSAGKAIRRVFLEPGECRPLPDVLEAIDRAHLVVLAPGSLYTSLLPNLLVPGVADALRSSPALKVLVANLMTEPGETDGFTLSDHVAAIVDHAGTGLVDAMLINQRPVSARALKRYAAAGAYPVAQDLDRVSQWGVSVHEADLMRATEMVRHHPQKLGRALLGLVVSEKRP